MISDSLTSDDLRISELTASRVNTAGARDGGDADAYPVWISVFSADGRSHLSISVTSEEHATGASSS